MITDRRKFIHAVGKTAGAAAIGCLFSTASASSEAATPEADVANIISKYGISKSVTRNPSGGSDFTVKMLDHGKFAKIFTDQARLPFQQIRVSGGNRLSFRHRGLDFNLIGVA
jgi:hypothetical protein